MERTGVGGVGIAAIICAALVVVGSFGTWATLSTSNNSYHAGGTEFGSYGTYTAVLGVLAGVMILLSIVSARPPASTYLVWGSLACFIVAGMIGLYVWSDLGRFIEHFSGWYEFWGIEISVGWGLLVLMAGAAGGAVFGFLMSRQPAIVPPGPAVTRW